MKLLLVCWIYCCSPEYLNEKQIGLPSHSATMLAASLPGRGTMESKKTPNKQNPKNPKPKTTKMNKQKPWHIFSCWNTFWTCLFWRSEVVLGLKLKISLPWIKESTSESLGEFLSLLSSIILTFEPTLLSSMGLQAVPPQEPPHLPSGFCSFISYAHVSSRRLPTPWNVHLLNKSFLAKLHH